MPSRFPFKFRIQAQPAALPKLISGPPPATKGLSATVAGPLSVRILFSGMNKVNKFVLALLHHPHSSLSFSLSSGVVSLRYAGLLTGACQLESSLLKLLKDVQCAQEHEM